MVVLDRFGIDAIYIFQETFMNQKTKEQQAQDQAAEPPHKAEQAYPSHAEVANEQKQKAEANEVAGRHKNDGQKDHKGARKV